MAVLHVVLLAFKEGLEDADRKRLHREFKTLITQIPGVESAEIGQNFRPTDSKFTDVVIIRMKSRETLAVYGPHEKHAEAGRVFAPHIQEALSFDIEV